MVFGIVGNSLSLLTLCRKNMLKNVSTTFFIGLGEYLCGYICFIKTHFVLNKFLLNSVADPGFLILCDNPQWGTQPNIRPNIPKNCIKNKKIEPRGLASKICLSRYASVLATCFERNCLSQKTQFS